LWFLCFLGLFGFVVFLCFFGFLCFLACFLWVTRERERTRLSDVTPA